MVRLCRLGGYFRRLCFRRQRFFSVEGTGPSFHIALSIVTDAAGAIIVATVTVHGDINIFHITTRRKRIEYIYTNGKRFRHRFILCHFPVAVPDKACQLHAASHRLAINGHFHENILGGHTGFHFADSDMYLRCTGRHFLLQCRAGTQ